MSNEGQYQPGDIVNGHILGSDNQWHPLMPGADQPPPATAGQAVKGATPESSTQSGTYAADAAGSATTSATESPASSQAGQAAAQAVKESGWRGLSTGKKVGIAGAGVLGPLLLTGLLAGNSEDEAEQSTAASTASATPGPTLSATRTPTPTPTPTPDPDVATFWASLTPELQQLRCGSYRGSDPAGTVNTIALSTSDSSTDVQAYLEQVCPPPPPKNYPAIDERTWQLIAKDPDAYADQTFLIFGEVTQFDSATGTDSFRADVAHTNTCEYGFFQGDNTLLSAGPGVDLSNVVNDDVFAAQITVIGAFSYDTQIGGSTTVPLLQVDSIEVQPTRCEFE